MATRTVRVLYTATAAPFIAQTNAASAASGRLAATSAAAASGVGGVGTSARTAVGGLNLFNPKLLGSAGLVVGLKSAATAALDFERESTKLQTQIGLSTEAADELAEAARNIGRQTGIGAQAAVEASFFIASAGLRGQEAMEALEFSAQAARVGLGETTDIADLLTSAMNAYGTEVLSAENATDVLLAAVREGKAEAPQLANALGSVLPVAAEMGVSFAEVAGNIANMTRTGTDANQAATQLTQLMAGLLKPSQGAAEAMLDFGLSAAELRRQVREEGLFEALMSIREAVGDNEEGLSRIFPNIRAFRGALDLTGAAALANADSLDRVRNSTGDLSNAVDIVADTATDSAARFKAAWHEVRLEIGEQTLPVLASAMEGLSRILDDQEDSLQDLARRIDPVNVVMGALGRETQQTAAQIDTLSGGLGTFERDLIDTADAAVALTDDGLDYLLQRGVDPADAALDELADAFGLTRIEIDALTGATEEATTALDRYEHMVRGTIDPVARLQQANEKAAIAQEEYNEAVAEYGVESEEARQAAADLTFAVFDLEGAAMSGRDALSDMTAQVDRLERQGSITTEQARLMREQIAFLNEEVAKFPGDYEANMNIRLDEDLLLRASAALDNLARPRSVDFIINEVTPRGFTAGPVAGINEDTPRGFTAGPVAGPFAGRVDGGRVSAGTPYVVGEHGKELFVPDRSGMIMSRAETQSMGGEKTYQLSVNTIRSDLDVMSEFRRMELLDV